MGLDASSTTISPTIVISSISRMLWGQTIGTILFVSDIVIS
jgi:hypothetical protein